MIVHQDGEINGRLQEACGDYVTLITQWNNSIKPMSGLRTWLQNDSNFIKTNYIIFNNECLIIFYAWFMCIIYTVFTWFVVHIRIVAQCITIWVQITLFL